MTPLSEPPGTIHTDFATFLQYVEEANPKLGKKSGLMTYTVRELNEHMTEPVTENSPRSRQTSYPRLHLYDFGDNWKFEIELREIRTEEPLLNNPVTVQEQGSAPQQYRTGR